MHLTGIGLAVIDHWDVGHDTEDINRCYVVADPQLIKKAMSRQSKAPPPGIAIQIVYEEPLRVPDSDQIQYAAPQTIHARDLYSTVRARDATTLVNAVPRPNPRGKRTLREVSGVVSRGSSSKANHAVQQYMYTKLMELIPGDANLYGVVVNMTLPKKSQRNDYYVGGFYYHCDVFK